MWKKGTAGLTGHGAASKGLAGSGRADHEDALGMRGLNKFFGSRKNYHSASSFLLRDAGHVIEDDRRPVGVVEVVCATAAKAEDIVAPRPCHLPWETTGEDPD